MQRSRLGSFGAASFALAAATAAFLSLAGAGISAAAPLPAPTPQEPMGWAVPGASATDAQCQAYADNSDRLVTQGERAFEAGATNLADLYWNRNMQVRREAAESGCALAYS